MELAQQSMDQEIEGTSLVVSSEQSEMDRFKSGIDGLVLGQIERKHTRLDTVMRFLADFELLGARESEFLKDLNIKLTMAKKIHLFHEQLKEECYRE